MLSHGCCRCRCPCDACCEDLDGDSSGSGGSSTTPITESSACCPSCFPWCSSCRRCGQSEEKCEYALLNTLIVIEFLTLLLNLFGLLVSIYYFGKAQMTSYVVVSSIAFLVPIVCALIVYVGDCTVAGCENRTVFNTYCYATWVFQCLPMFILQLHAMIVTRDVNFGVSISSCVFGMLCFFLGFLMRIGGVHEKESAMVRMRHLDESAMLHPEQQQF